MYSFKKGIGSVVVTSLILVVAVISITSFETWFESYSSSIETKIQSEEIDGQIKISLPNDKNLILTSKKNITIQTLKILDKNNNVMCDLYVDSILTDLKPYEVLHFDFDSKNSTHIFDLSGNGNHGEIKNNTNCNYKGFDSDSCVFDGEANLIQIPRNSQLEPRAITIATWFYWDDPSKSTWGKIINKHKETNSHPFKSYEFGHFSNTQGMTFTINNGTTHHATPYYDINEKEWLFLTGTWDPDLGILSFYLNGILVANKTNITGEILYYNTDLVLGWEDTSPMSNVRAIAGKMDETFLYNKSLDSNEVYKLYKTTKAILNQTKTFTNSLDLSTTTCLLEKGEYEVVVGTKNEIYSYQAYLN